jgi:hypothetical protein
MNCGLIHYCMLYAANVFAVKITVPYFHIADPAKFSYPPFPSLQSWRENSRSVVIRFDQDFFSMF